MSRLFSYVTPLMIVSLMGVIMILYGLMQLGRENNILQFIFGIPIALGAAGFHFLIRRVLHQHTLNIWIVEAIIVAALWYQFMYVW
ncbi:hypothetical protein M0L20_24320 [Spirosoma sp. RP8]|uniref:Uncharacterized protein n=1 Tax=Spirosoma liriopis TaxID=2937440 RepID=A0ABT0HS72_9BACT|nr:hypothetical protein [Spirosoma liriopis]MCK8495019.1 hypothetical protein [Spirosoma liriopis]